jgi:hypothetical protein
MRTVIGRPPPAVQMSRVEDAVAVWAEFAGIFARTRAAHLEHEQAKAELKSLMPDDTKEGWDR